jgi:hypothetical protein
VVQPAPIVVDRASAHVRARGPVLTWAPADADDRSSGDGIEEGSLIRDTLRSQAFTATLDTVLAHDTVHVEFTFPPPAFSVVVRPAPDSIMERNVQTIVTQEVYRAPAWYEEAGKVLLGVAAGYALRLTTEH